MTNSPIFLFIGAAVGLFASAFMFMNIDSKYTVTHETIVEHGCAQFNPLTADFEWLDTLSIPKDGVSTCSK